jgi:hypothetical protein
VPRFTRSHLREPVKLAGGATTIPSRSCIHENQEMLYALISVNFEIIRFPPDCNNLD